MRIERVNDGIEIYLEVEFDEMIKFDQLSHRLIASYQEHLLPCELIVEYPLKLRYKITGLEHLVIPLRQSNTRDDIISYYQQLNQILTEMQEYLLNPSYVYFSFSSVLINQSTGRIFLLVFPIQSIFDENSYANWIANSLYTTNLRECDISFFNKLIVYTQSDMFCIAGFTEMLSQNLLNTPVQINRNNKLQNSNSTNIVQKKYTHNIKTIQKIYNSALIQKLAFLISQILILFLCYKIVNIIPNYSSDLLKANIGVFMIALSFEIIILKKAYMAFGKRTILHRKTNDVDNADLPDNVNEIDEVRLPEKFTKPLGGQLVNRCEDTTVLNSEDNPCLEMLNGELKFILEKRNLTLGRSTDLSDVRIDYPTIGRTHCQLYYANKTFKLLDLSSKNGTYVNGAEVSTIEPHLLNHGDIVKLADLEFAYHAF